MWKRTYQVLRSSQIPKSNPQTNSNLNQSLTSTSASPRRPVSTLPGQHVQYILNQIRDRDGLCRFTPHVEYLIGSNKSAFDSSAGSANSGGGGLDIADKTQLILQSTHPVRFVVEREIRALRSREELDLKYLDWITIFGRSLIQPKSRLKHALAENPTEKLSFEEKLGNVGTASECGMFSADVHQTVVNITANLKPGRARSEFHLGNKYAVLVGDYFAIKTIYFAEKVKSSPVFLEIIRGVEDFTYSSFVSKLLESEIGYPILPCEGASAEDWIAYGIKVSGYFTGGLNAAFTLLNIIHLENNDKHKLPTKEDKDNLHIFVSNLALTLKAVNDLQEFKNSFQDTSVSPFLFISLPAILYQMKNKEIFSNLRSSEYDFNIERVNEIRHLIGQSDAVPQSRELIQEFASRAEKAFSKIGQDEFYSHVMLDLLRHAASSSEI